MSFDPFHHRRRSLRLKGYDYSRAGAYFVTICAQDRACLFGEIRDQKITLSPAGLMILSVWESIPEKFPSIDLDAFIIMPNHIHLILQIIRESVGAATGGRPDLAAHTNLAAPLNQGQAQGLTGGQAQGLTGGQAQGLTGGQAQGPAPTLGDVVGWFKSLTTAKYRHGVRDHNWPRFRKRLWQRNYWEHIIRDEKSLNRLRRYIENNPLTWESDDQLHPNRPSKW